MINAILRTVQEGKPSQRERERDGNLKRQNDGESDDLIKSYMWRERMREREREREKRDGEREREKRWRERERERERE